MPNLMSPLSAQEISTLLGNIRDAAVSSNAGVAASATAVGATVRGLREFCGETEVTLAMLAFTGAQLTHATTHADN